MKGYNQEFCEAIARRGLTLKKLSELAIVGRCHLSQVLNGRRRGGEKTWKLLSRVLTMEEYDLARKHALRMRSEMSGEPSVEAVLETAKN
jgi:transcriptional regulator with XRE-family HTH domain